MITTTGLRWLVTLAFTLVGMAFLYRCLRTGSVTDRINDVLHALMCAGMILMAWPATMAFAGTGQFTLFSAATLWFLGLAVFTGQRHGHHGGRVGLIRHALMMAAMAWMVAAMPLAMAGTHVALSVDESGHHAGHAGSGHAASGSPSISAEPPGHIVVVATVLTLVFLVLGINRLARAIDIARADTSTARRGVSPVRWQAASPAIEAVMSLGMALMVGLML